MARPDLSPMKEIEGSYAWAGNNRYGDNHRTLEIRLRKPGKYGFEHVEITSAGGMGKAGDTVRGRVEKTGEGEFVLIGEKDESWVQDDDPWSETRPSKVRWKLVYRTPKEVELDGKTYARSK